MKVTTSTFALHALCFSTLLLATTSLASCVSAAHHHSLNLSNLPVWKRQAGYWISNQTFLGSNGKPYTIDTWPYSYGVYKGFTKIEISGSELKERNIYLYTPLSRDKCHARRSAELPTVLGNGKCGRNANEKVFKADIKAIDLNGNLAGTFNSGKLTANVSATAIGNDTVLYRFTIGGNLFQNLLTTVVGNTRVRTAQFFTRQSSLAASYYREKKVSEAEWHEALRNARRRFKVHREDHCGYFVNDVRTGISCSEWFTN